MRTADDTTEEQVGSATANRYLRRAVDHCLGDGIGREQVAEALVRMAEAVASEIAEERAEYRACLETAEGIDQFPVGNECSCGFVYSADHRYCSRCGSGLKPSIVPRAIPGRLQFHRRVGKGGGGGVYAAAAPAP